MFNFLFRTFNTDFTAFCAEIGIYNIFTTKRSWLHVNVVRKVNARIRKVILLFFAKRFLRFDIKMRELINDICLFENTVMKTFAKKL